MLARECITFTYQNNIKGTYMIELNYYKFCIGFINRKLNKIRNNISNKNI